MSSNRPASAQRPGGTAVQLPGGDRTAVAHEAQPREYDAEPFQHAGFDGVRAVRIVHVGGMEVWEAFTGGEGRDEAANRPTGGKRAYRRPRGSFNRG